MSRPFSLDTIWNTLLHGDPGPALAFVEALIENDMAYAAGGFLQDLVERVHDAQDTIEQEQQRVQFVEAAKHVVLASVGNDKAALNEFLSSCS